MAFNRKPTRSEEPAEPMHHRIHETSPFLNGAADQRRAELADSEHPNLALVKGGHYVGKDCRHLAPNPSTNDCRFACASKAVAS